MSGMVLYAEVKMGGLFKEIPRAKLKRRIVDANTGESIKTELQKTGISKRDRSWAKTLAENEDAIEEVVEEEIKKGNLPTREKVLRKVRENKAERDREALKRKVKTYSKMKKY